MPCISLIGDILVLLAFSTSVIDFCSGWQNIKYCRHPIQLWLMVSYGSIGIFRIGHYLNSSTLSVIHSAWFAICPATQRSKCISALIFGLLVPAFLCWTILGTVWLAEIEKAAPHCLVSPSHSWYFVIWLGICYAWVAFYCLLVLVALMMEEQTMSQAALHQRLSQEVYGLSSWNEASLYIAHEHSRGMKSRHIAALPTFLYEGPSKSQSTCSICIQDYQKGDCIRELEPCGHRFHSTCIDVWLHRSSFCPNCKRTIKPATYPWGFIQSKFLPSSLVALLDSSRLLSPVSMDGAGDIELSPFV
eukprot:Platyproteum_vivax@DN1672_c0_g1_i1.p1